MPIASQNPFAPTETSPLFGMSGIQPTGYRLPPYANSVASNVVDMLKDEKIKWTDEQLLQQAQQSIMDAYQAGEPIEDENIFNRVMNTIQAHEL